MVGTGYLALKQPRLETSLGQAGQGFACLSFTHTVPLTPFSAPDNSIGSC